MKTVLYRWSKLAVSGIVISSVSLYAVNLDKDNPCYHSIQKIDDTYKNNKVFKMLMDQSFKHMVQAPEGYMHGGNPWIGKNYKDLPLFLEEWCEFLPKAKVVTMMD